MNKVWIFGDSYSMNYNHDGAFWFVEYIKYKKRPVKNYGDFLSEKFNYECKNFAFGGNDNFSIFETICDNIEHIQKNDIVIVGWAPQTRYRIVDNNKWTVIIGECHENINDLSKTTLNEMLLHRNNELYFDELKTWEKLIKHKLEGTFFHTWCWHMDGLWTKYESIEIDTNGLVKDGHWSENGHKDFSITLIEKIKFWKENL